MQRARDELLAGPGLAGDERGAHVRRQPPDHPEQLLHHRAAADHPAELEAAGDVALDGEQVAAPLEVVAHAGEQLLEPREVERLAQVIRRAELDRLDRGVDRRVAGHQHGLAARIDLANRARARRARRRPASADRPSRGRRAASAAARPRRARSSRSSPRIPARCAKRLDHVENALLVVDDHQQRLLPVHTYSFEIPRSAPRSAASSNGGADPLGSRGLRHENAAPPGRRRSTAHPRHASGSAAISALSTSATSHATRRQARARFVRALRRRDRVAPAGERRRDVVALGRIAVRDQRPQRLLVRARRQQHLERRALSDAALDGNLAAVIADDAVADAEAEPGAFADLAGGEERIEDPPAGSRRECRGRCRR